jgi:hypothetical protein
MKHMARKKTDLITEPADDSTPANQGKILRREVSKAPTFFSVYINDAQITSNPFDVRIVLGEVGDLSIEEADPVANILLLGELRMSPQLAKKITVMLIQQLQAYEKKFGQIPQPD